MNLVTIGFANVAVLDEQILGVLGEAWGRGDTEGGCTVILKWSRIFLWISKPGQIATVELDMLGSYGEGVELGVGRINGDLGRLDLGDDMWKGALSDPMQKEMESWLPPVVGCTAKAASQEATRIDPSVVNQVGPRSWHPLK